MSERALVPIEEKQVVFYEDEVTAVLVDVADRPQVFVPLRPLADLLGVSWTGQYERIQRDPVLSEVTRSVRVTRTQDQAREMVCLPLDYLNGWLFGINANRVKASIRERLIRYQRECYQVLAEAFMGGAPQTAVSRAESTLLQVREMGLAIARMAEEQIEFDRRLITTEDRLDKAATVVGDLTRRMSRLEQRLASGEPVTEEQASQISQAVKAVAIVEGWSGMLPGRPNAGRAERWVGLLVAMTPAHTTPADSERIDDVFRASKAACNKIIRQMEAGAATPPGQPTPPA